jgi:hypothetical protein
LREEQATTVAALRQFEAGPAEKRAGAKPLAAQAARRKKPSG